MAVFSIVYFPLFFYIDGVILEIQMKKAVERYAKDYCQLDLIVTEIEYSRSWPFGPKSWEAITKPEFKDISGYFNRGRAELSYGCESYSLGSHFILNRNTTQFVQESYDSPRGFSKAQTSINYFFASLFVLFMIYMIFLHIETKGMENESEI